MAHHSAKKASHCLGLFAKSNERQAESFAQLRVVQSREKAFTRLFESEHAHCGAEVRGAQRTPLEAAHEAHECGLEFERSYAGPRVGHQFACLRLHHQRYIYILFLLLIKFILE